VSHSALNDEQFAGHKVGETGTMSPHRLAEGYWDPNLKNPQALRDWSGPGYIEGLASDIREHGLRDPVQIRAGSQPHIYDGHHRVIAAMDIGLKEVPYKVVSGVPGEQ
jgi:ParB/Sulfiredoxin domain